MTASMAASASATKGTNVAAHLAAIARTTPDAIAVIDSRRSSRRQTSETSAQHRAQITFGELEAESNRLARGLLRSGVAAGTRTVLMLPPSLEFFALTFALFKAGAVPVLIDPGMGFRRLKRCLAEAQPQAFVGSAKAHAARIAFRWARRTLRVRVVVGPRFAPGLVPIDHVRERGRSGFPLALPSDEPGTMAAILFTSGSTGPPKGVIYTHAMFNAQVEHLRESFQIARGEVDLCTFPLFSLFAMALGLTAIIPEMDPTRPARVDAGRLIETIATHQVQNLFGSPALLNRVAAHGIDPEIKLSSLRRVISAGAPVGSAILARFQRLLPEGVEIFTPYGATEALPLTRIGSREILEETAARTAEGAGICVGRPLPGIDIAVVAIADDPALDEKAAIEEWSDALRLPAGEIGEICVQGPVVSREYYNRPQATFLSKIPAGEIGRFFHRTGDAGYLDARGRLWFCGRKTQRVRTADRTLFTIPCEGVFNVHPAVHRSALVGVKRGAGCEPVLCVELVPNGERRAHDTIEKELLELGARHSVTAGIRKILFRRALPVDIRHNSKIAREELARWATRRLR